MKFLTTTGLLLAITISGSCFAAMEDAAPSRMKCMWLDDRDSGDNYAVFKLKKEDKRAFEGTYEITQVMNGKKITQEKNGKKVVKKIHAIFNYTAGFTSLTLDELVGNFGSMTYKVGMRDDYSIRFDEVGSLGQVDMFFCGEAPVKAD
jgi:hypothetical protein